MPYSEALLKPYPGIENAYSQQKSRVEARNQDFDISLEEFVMIWHLSKKWDQRGNQAEQYCLARKKRKSPFTIDNVHVITNRENGFNGSKEDIEQRSIAGTKSMENRKKQGYYFKTVTPLGKFDSLREAGRAHDMTAMAITKKLNNKNMPDYYREFEDGTVDLGSEDRRIHSGDRKKTLGMLVLTPKGIFNSAKIAAPILGISEATMMRRLKDENITEFTRIKADELESVELLQSGKAIQTTVGIFLDIEDVAVHFELEQHEVQEKIRNPDNSDFVFFNV